jgi:hypothetical protein
MQDLETRVAALERANRRYRLVFAVMLLGIGALVASGSGGQVPDKIQAKAFEVVNDAGRVLASMTTYEGNGSISTFNPKGKYLTDIVATKSGAGGIVTYDGDGHQNLKITDVSGGGGSIVLNNSTGVGVLDFGHNNVGAGSVTGRNKDGKKISLLTSDTEHSGVFLTYDASEKQTARVPSGGD